MITLNDIPDYSAVSQHIIGTPVKIKDVIGCPIVIWRFELTESRYRHEDGDPEKLYMKILFSYEKDLNHKFVMGTSSYYVINDIRSVQQSLPVRTTIIHSPLPIKPGSTQQRYAYRLS